MGPSQLLPWEGMKQTVPQRRKFQRNSEIYTEDEVSRFLKDRQALSKFSLLPGFAVLPRWCTSDPFIYLLERKCAMTELSNNP